MLELVPKVEKYIQYMLDIILKLPRVEKFNIGNETKMVMYNMLENILYLSKVEYKKRIDYLNKIDGEVLILRVFVRLMYKNKWIDYKKYMYSINLVNEIGKMVGGYIKSYGKNI